MRKKSDHTNGTVYEFDGYTVFEDNQQGDDAVVFYAWRGAFEDHDTAEHVTVRDLEHAAELFA